MFNNVVISTPFSESIAEELLSAKVKFINPCNGPVFRGSYDTSLQSTCRAILFNRIPDGVQLQLFYYDWNGIHDVKNKILNVFDKRRPVSLTLVKINTTLNMDDVKETFDKLDDGRWKEVEKVRLFCMKHFQCYCYVREDTMESVILFQCRHSTDTIIRFYHSIQCTIFNALPWFCDPNTITDDEKALLLSIASGNYEDYKKVLTKISEELDFKQNAIDTLLEKFEKEIDEQAEKRYTDQIEDLEYKIRNYLNQIETLSTKKRDAMIYLSGIKAGIIQKDGKSDLRDAFHSFDGLRFIKMINGNSILFSVDKYMDSWDNAARDNLIHYHSSSIYHCVPPSMHNLFEKLLMKIFETREIKVKMSGVFQLFSNSRLNPYRAQREDIPADYIPNPHIDEYGCIEGYRGDIAEALASSDFVHAIEIATVSAGNVNFEDSTVMSYFGRYMYERKCEGRTCFELPDGKMVGFDDAMKWVEEQENGGTENEQTD